MSRVVKSAVLLAASFAPLQAESQSYYCEAQGVYTVCVTERGYEQCEDRAAMGGAAGADRAGTQQNAIIDCTSNQMSGVQRGNFPTGSSTKTSRAFSKTPCQVTTCKDYTGAPPAAGGGGSSFDQFMAQGDQLATAGDIVSAVQLWTQAAQLEPKRDDPYLHADLFLLRAGRWQEACGYIDQGLQVVGATVGLQVSAAECAIYRGQFDQAEQYAISVMQSGANADATLAANLLGWIGSSLKNGVLVPCGGFASALSQRSAIPAWDFTSLTGYLASTQSEVAAQVGQLVARLQSTGVGSAADFQAACGQ